MFDSLKYLQDRGFHYITEGKNCSSGWTAICCPFCLDNKFHGGFSPEGNYYCWKCGYHPISDIIMILENVPPYKAHQIEQEYERPSIQVPLEEHQIIKTSNKLRWPLGTTILEYRHKQYLIQRGFDPAYLIRKYKIKGTGPVGPYCHRIIIPIFLNGTMVSYQGRDITDKSPQRYKVCPKDEELIFHKEILYNIDNTNDKAVIVEGILDVWRLGDGAVATFGTSATPKQISFIARRFKRIFILFDSEPPAQTKARKLMNTISVLSGIQVTTIQLEKGDPADMPQDDADYMMKELLGKRSKNQRR
jgi:hypothetical protein